MLQTEGLSGVSGNKLRNTIGYFKRKRDIFWINLKEQGISVLNSLLINGNLLKMMKNSMEQQNSLIGNNGEKVKFLTSQRNMIVFPLWEALKSLM